MPRKTIASLEAQIARLQGRVSVLYDENRKLQPEYWELDTEKTIEAEQLSQNKEYRGVYKGIYYSAVKWKPYESQESKERRENSCWGWTPEWKSNGYIYINRNLINTWHRPTFFLTPIENTQKYGPKYHYDYYGLDFEGIHGGVTWYSIESEGEVAKIGWDYHHSWDIDARLNPSVQWIVSDCKRTIDSILERYPDLFCVKEQYVEGAD